jgi:cephalosporin hydroxylase
MNIHELFEQRAATPSDINEHMELLSVWACCCDHVTEFGVRSGNSTVAFLAGLANTGSKKLVSYDQNAPSFAPPPTPGVEWEFHQADTANLPDIEPTDLLFIDTLHTAEQVRAELRHAHRVRRLLMFHDTVLFGSRDESPGTGPGINHAIFRFLSTNEGQKWSVAFHAPNSNGLLALVRR